MTETERLARIGEPVCVQRTGRLLRLRELIMAAHEEQIERIDSRLGALYPAAFLEVVATAQGQGQETLDFLEWWARRGSGVIADLQTAS